MSVPVMLAHANCDVPLLSLAAQTAEALKLPIYKEPERVFI